MKPTRFLIVNADDLGLSSSVNEAVVRAHREGILTSASLMVNEPGFDEAVRLARENPRLAIGLHLTLVDGHSTLSAKEIPGLVNARGEFSASPASAGIKYFCQPSLKEQLRAEIRAQFDKFCATGLELDHVNSHHHLHAHPTICNLLMESAAEMKISRLRVTSEPLLLQRRFAHCGFSGWRDAGVHRVLARGIRRHLQRRGILYTDAVFGVVRNGRVDQSYLQRLLPLLPDGISEIYSHPSLDTFKHELDALISPATRKLVDALGIQLIRYRDIETVKRRVGGLL